MKKSSPRIGGELGDRVFWYQLHVFQIGQWLICYVPSFLVVVLLLPTVKLFMEGGPQIWYMTLLKLLVIVPFVLLFVALAYLGFLLAAGLGIVLVRLLIPELRMPDARAILLQFYSDPRWLYMSPGTKRFPWWISLWGGMGNNQHLNRWCRRLSAATISLIYSHQPGAADSVE